MREETKKQMRSYGLSTADILLPKKGSDFYRWAVVACDQYTSQKEYWKKVEEITKGVKSSYKLIYPECYLEDGDKDKIISDINKSMDEYLASDFFTEYKDCFILVERTTESGTRYGLMAALDLEDYSFAEDSKSLIRATEGTILSRIPPRKEIRKNAPLEIPHIMVLISDEKRQIIEALKAKKDSLEVVYETDLMLDGGHVKGYLVCSDEDLSLVERGFTALYKELDKDNPILFAMGDGNHSLATAKSCWEDIKADLSDKEREIHPARYALVELENIYDEALFFEPIHRIILNLDSAFLLKQLESMNSGKKIGKTSVKDLKALEKVLNTSDGSQKIGIIKQGAYSVLSLAEPLYSISALTIQKLIDVLPEGCGVDYIHGADVVERISNENKECTGLILPDISKATFFETIKRDRAFPRKTFSMGHANEKRFYMEAKRIKL